MRIILVLAVALLLSGCAWMHRELTPVAPVPPVTTPVKPAPIEVHPQHKPAPVHVERPPAPPPVQSVSSTPAPLAPPDYSGRCHAMADNRAADARQLGASGADLTKVQQDTYRDCMAQSVKPAQ